MRFVSRILSISALTAIVGASVDTAAQVSGNSGSFTTSVPIAVPGYRGLEPSIALAYSSSGGSWMKRRLLLAIASVSMQSAAPTGSLQLIVALDSETYVMKDWVEIEIKVVNVGETALSFLPHFRLGYGSHGGPTLEYVVREKDGEKLNKFVIVSHRDPREPAPAGALAPGESVKATVRFRAEELVRKPGEYTIEFRYLAPETSGEELESEPPIWTRDSGPLVGSAEFEVVEAPK